MLDRIRHTFKLLKSRLSSPTRQEISFNERLWKSHEHSDFTKFLLAVDKIKGFANYDDLMTFKVILELQSLLDVSGDLLEIGSFYGKSASLLFHCLKDNETLYVCDLFESACQEIHDKYSSYPEKESVRKTILQMNPKQKSGNLELIKGSSRDLSFSNNQLFRFIHIDGGHEYQDCYHDLEFSANHLKSRGIIAIDDYEHPKWPDVTLACNDFLRTQTAIRILFVFNRINAQGQKIYLVQR